MVYWSIYYFSKYHSLKYFPVWQPLAWTSVRVTVSTIKVKINGQIVAETDGYNALTRYSGLSRGKHDGPQHQQHVSSCEVLVTELYEASTHSYV